MRAISSPRPAPTDQSSCVQLLIKLTFVLKDEGVSRSSWGALSLGLSDLHNTAKVKRLTAVLYHCDAIPAYCVTVISWNRADWKYCILLVFNIDIYSYKKNKYFEQVAKILCLFIKWFWIKSKYCECMCMYAFSPRGPGSKFEVTMAVHLNLHPAHPMYILFTTWWS